MALREILAWADAHAPALRIADSRMARADAAHADARPLVPADPSVQVAAGPRWAEQGRAVDVQASLSQRVEVAGERRRRLAYAEKVEHRLEAERASARWQVHQRVHHAFHDALAAREHRRLTERLVAFERRVLEMERRRLEAGDVSPLAVRVAEGELARARAHGLEARRRYEDQRLELAEAAGWPVAHPPEPAGELDPPRPPPPEARLVELAEANQPRLHALTATIEEARARLALADRERWPDVGFGVQYNREGKAQGQSEHSLLGRLSFALPLWRRNGRARAEARAELEEALARRDAFVQRLRARIARGLRTVRAAGERVRLHGTELVPAFEESLHMVERAHELGEVDALEVSVAVGRFLDVQEEALEAYETYHEAVAALEAAVGTDLWEGERHRDGKGKP